MTVTGGRAAVLVTGMSGAGKSTALALLAARGHRVVDTDDPGWILAGPEPLWDLERIGALLDGHRAGRLFVAGCVANQGSVADRFDAVVLLHAPVPVLLGRVADRANPWGSTPEQRAVIARDAALVVPLLRAGATHELDATAPPASVVDALERIAAAAAG